MIRKLVLATLLVLSIQQAKAGHILGGAVYWEHIAQDTFIFHLEIIAACGSLSLPSTFSISGPNGIIPVNFISAVQINPACADPCTPLHFYQSAPVALTGSPPASGWEFSFSVCCTSPSSIIPNSSWYTSATMYPDTNGLVPQFSAIPTSAKRLELNVPANHTIYLGSANGIHADSVMTDLVPVKSSANNSANYKTGFSGTAPLPDATESALNGPNIYNRINATLNITVNDTLNLESYYYAALEHNFYQHGIAYAKIDRVIPIRLLATPPPTTPLLTSASFSGSSVSASSTGLSFNDTAAFGDTLRYTFFAFLTGSPLHFQVSSNLPDSARAAAMGWTNFNHLQVINNNPNQQEPNMNSTSYELVFIPDSDNFNQPVNTINVKISTDPCGGGQEQTIPITLILESLLTLPNGNVGADTLELCNTTDSIEISATNTNFHWQPSSLVSDSTANKVAFTGQNATWLYLVNSQNGRRDSIFVIPRNNGIVLGITRNQNTLILADPIGLDSIVWKLNGANLVVNQNQINMTATGSYSVIGYTKNCTFYSDTFLVNSLDISLSENNIAQFSVYPNPAKNQLSISFKEATKATFTIYSLSGKALIEKELSPNNYSLDISALAAGSYLIKSELGVLKFRKE